MKGFINYREINRNVMDDTMKMCDHNKTLKDSIANSIRNEYVVYQSKAFYEKHILEYENGEINDMGSDDSRSLWLLNSIDKNGRYYI